MKKLRPFDPEQGPPTNLRRMRRELQRGGYDVPPPARARYNYPWEDGRYLISQKAPSTTTTALLTSILTKTTSAQSALNAEWDSIKEWLEQPDAVLLTINRDIFKEEFKIDEKVFAKIQESGFKLSPCPNIMVENFIVGVPPKSPGGRLYTLYTNGVHSLWSFSAAHGDWGGCNLDTSFADLSDSARRVAECMISNYLYILYQFYHYPAKFIRLKAYKSLPKKVKVFQLNTKDNWVWVDALGLPDDANVITTKIDEITGQFMYLIIDNPLE